MLEYVFDLLLFKMAFHTYEILSNKHKVMTRRPKQDDDDIAS